MRSLTILALLAMVFCPSAALAGNVEQTPAYAYCKSRGDMVYNIAKARDAGVPKIRIIGKLDEICMKEHATPKEEEDLIEVIDVIYQTKILSPAEERDTFTSGCNAGSKFAR